MAYRFPNKEYLYLSKIPYLFYRIRWRFQ